ncbi:MAG: sigma-70 family RNA polymerase sigma factor [Oscillospiraceae bacterium]|nr:sigma-70 family RNA polymerase sigma factor [Oscillospiraceae bacterium]
MTDTQIIDLFFERSEQAIEELAKKHGAAVSRIAFNILGDPQDTEECVNDTWLGAWNAIPPSRPSPLRTFVCRIARNLATKKYHAGMAQKRNSQYDLALDELCEYIPDSDSVEDRCGARELAAAIDRFLDGLEPLDRFLFMRRYWYSDSLGELAKLSAMSYGAVSVRLHRVKEKLKNYLLREGLLV